jgi:hypothetical protein
LVYTKTSGFLNPQLSTSPQTLPPYPTIQNNPMAESNLLNGDNPISQAKDPACSKSDGITPGFNQGLGIDNGVWNPNILQTPNLIQADREIRNKRILNLEKDHSSRPRFGRFTSGFNQEQGNKTNTLNPGKAGRKNKRVGNSSLESKHSALPGFGLVSHRLFHLSGMDSGIGDIQGIMGQDLNGLVEFGLGEGNGVINVNEWGEKDKLSPRKIIQYPLPMFQDESFKSHPKNLYQPHPLFTNDLFKSPHKIFHIPLPGFIDNSTNINPNSPRKIVYRPHPIVLSNSFKSHERTFN